MASHHQHRGASTEYRFERAIGMAADIAATHANRLIATAGKNHPAAQVAQLIEQEIRSLCRHQPEGYRRKIEQGRGERVL